MNSRTVLVDGRENVRGRWIQNELASSEGVCVLGALREAAFGHPVIITVDSHWLKRALAYNGAVDAIRAVTKDAIPDWNDCVGRTEAEVVEVFNMAIAHIDRRRGRR